MKQIFLALSMLSSFCFGMQITRAGQDYSVFDGTQSHAVKPYMVDPLLKRMNPEQLQKFVEQGNRIKAIRLSDGDYRLQAKVPGLGGGPISGAIAYWTTKVLCYGTAAAAATTIVVTTGGTAAALATGAAATIAAGSVAAGAGTAVVAGVTAQVAAGVVAGSITAAAGMVEGAALTTVATVSAAGSVASAVAAVETASTAAGLFFTVIPFLP